METLPDTKAKRKKRLLTAALISPLFMPLLGILLLASPFSTSIDFAISKEVSAVLKVLWLAGIGTVAVFFTTMRKEAKPIFALFYAITATAVGHLMTFVYAIMAIILSCIFQTCEVP